MPARPALSRTPEIKRLQKSISLLESTNAQLLESLAPGPSSNASAELDADDRRVFEETLDENKTAIAAQIERVEMCVVIIRARLGVSGAGSAHYAMAAGQAAASSAGPAQRDGEAVARDANGGSRSSMTDGQASSTSDAPQQEDGLYL